MAKNVAAQALLKPTAERKRNVFPLDNQHVFSVRTGQITPVKTYSFVPGDFFKIKTSDTAITFPLNTAAFLRARKETSAYMVYNNAVWSLFNQYMAQRQDPKTSAFGTSPQLVEPRISLADLYYATWWQWVAYCVYTHYLSLYARENDLDLAEIQRNFLEEIRSNIDDDLSIWTPVQEFTPAWIFANSPAWDNIAFRNYVNGSFRIPFLYGKKLSDVTQEDIYCDIVGHFRAYSWVKKLDMLGYGNLYPILRQYEDRIRTAASSGSSFDSFVPTFKQHLYRCCMQIMNSAFGVQIGPSPAEQFENLKPAYVNLYKLCAYNSVFYHRYRNSFYDNNYYVHDYSLDFVSVSPSSSTTPYRTMNDFSWRFLDLEYHQWKKDVFTAVLPDTQFGAVQSVSLNSVKIFNEASTNSVSQVRVDGNDSSSPNLLYADRGPAPQNTFWNIPNAFDVIALKRAEMLQDYMQTLMRAGNRTSDVFKALYGGSPSSEHEDDILPRCLDSFGESIDINPVIATAATGNANNGNLGDIAARASFRGDGTLKFNAGHNFGTLLFVTYVVPDASYNSYMLEKDNLELSPEQHFLPAYENFGLEPVYTDELNMLIPRKDIQSLGYAPRYYHKKMELDKVHGAFCSYSAYISDALGAGPRPVSWFGEFNHWVAPRTEMQTRNITVLRDFYINPSVLDNVFVNAVTGDIADDQFINVVNFDVKATRQFTKIGLIDFV